MCAIYNKKYASQNQIYTPHTKENGELSKSAHLIKSKRNDDTSAQHNGNKPNESNMMNHNIMKADLRQPCCSLRCSIKALYLDVRMMSLEQKT